jgi:predicted MFS family arabinose efflux permease
MTSSDGKTEGSPIIFDGWRSVSIALFMALVGYSVMVTVPVLSTALVNKVGFGEGEVGRIWGNDLLGFAIGSIIVAVLVAKVNRRYLVVAGIVMTAGGNALCMVFDSYTAMLVLRVAAGIGSGIFTGVAIATLGGATNTVRVFNLLLFAFAFTTAFELWLFPKLTMNGIYLFLIGTTAVCAVCLHWIPRRPLTAEELSQQEKVEDQEEDWRVPKFVPIICLTALTFCYINIGGYYTYIELGALADNIDQNWTGLVLEVTGFLGVLGCGIAFLCTRFGLFKPLFAGLIAMSMSVIMLSGGITNTNLAVSLFGFMTFWTFVDVFQSAMISNMDRSGAMVALMPAVEGFGQFIGPHMGATILEREMGYGVLFKASGSMTVFAMLLYFGVFLYMHRNKRASAEAT